MRALLSWVAAASIGAVTAVIGCGGNVVLEPTGAGNTGGGGNGGAGGTVSPTGGPSGQGSAIILEQGTVQLRFASAGVTCQSTEGIPPDCGWWRIDIYLADPSQLTPGVLDLGSNGLDVFIQESGNPNSPDPGDCPGAVGGGALPATLVIQSVDDDQAVVELQGFDTYLLDGQADGVYTAPRCN